MGLETRLASKLVSTEKLVSNWYGDPIFDRLETVPPRRGSTRLGLEGVVSLGVVRYPRCLQCISNRDRRDRYHRDTPIRYPAVRYQRGINCR